MMPNPAGDDEMSLREIARTLSDFRAEFRSQITQMLRTDVYRAEQSALVARIASLEKDSDPTLTTRVVGLEKDRDAAEAAAGANKRLALGAMFTCVVTIVSALLLIALTR